MKRLAAPSLALVTLALAAALLIERRSNRSGIPVIHPAASAPSAAGIEGPYFSDRDRVAGHIVAAVNNARRSLDAAIYDLTEPEISAAITSAWQRGISIRIVADEGQARERHSRIPYLEAEGIPVRLARGYRGGRSIMHDKFAIFDGTLVVTGSFNWTTSADRYNYENAIFISDRAVAERYEREFETIWESAEGH